MISSHLGEVSALAVAFFWTITALAFEHASVRVGSLSVNFLRLVMAFVFLSIFSWLYRGLPLPTDAGPENWGWLSLSGVIGFVLGDLFLFKSYTMIGSRFSMLVMTLVPPITAFTGWIILGETLSLYNLFGMFLTFAGIALAIFSRRSKDPERTRRLSPRGILYAFGGAVGQAVGLVLSKLGMGNYDAFAATQIRIITGMVGFGIIVLLLRRTSNIKKAVRNKKGMRSILIGSFFGPFLGVSLSLFAVQHTTTGIASTIMAIVPILIIPPAILFFKQKVTLPEIIGAFLSVSGVALFFIE